MSLNVGRNFKLGELREQCHNEAIASRTFNLEKYQTFLHSSSLPTKSFMINKEVKKWTQFSIILSREITIHFFQTPTHNMQMISPVTWRDLSDHRRRLVPLRALKAKVRQPAEKLVQWASSSLCFVCLVYYRKCMGLLHVWCGAWCMCVAVSRDLRVWSSCAANYLGRIMTLSPLDTVAAFGTLQIDVPKRISQYWIYSLTMSSAINLNRE